MDLSKVDEQRQALEHNLQELRQSLKHWQILDAEYEGLKEAVLADPVELDTATLENIAKTYGGDLVDEKTIREITGLDKNSPRSAQQIVGLVDRRQEYVQSNIETIQRRFFDAEAKLEEFDFAASRDSETGLPLTEITEELDDDDNVISSSLSQPESTTDKLVESLRKAGLTKEDLGMPADHAEHLKPAIVHASPAVAPFTPAPDTRRPSVSSAIGANGDSANDQDGSRQVPTRKKSVSFAADTKESTEMVRIDSEERRKSVSFAEKVAVAPAAALPDNRSVSFSPKIEEIPPQPLGPPSPVGVIDSANSDSAQKGSPPVSEPKSASSTKSLAQSELQKDLRASFKPGDKVLLINDDEEVESEHIVLPEDETDEEALIRRQMLDYHLNEVGHVVAQMNLDDGYGDEDDDEDEEDDDDDDGSSRYTGSTYPDDEDTPYTSNHSDYENEDDDDEEDAFGRTKRRIVTDKYRQEMLEMEKRLIGNLGAAPNDEDLSNMEIDPQDVRRLVIQDKPGSVSSTNSDNNDKKAINNKKRVSFAEDVDVAAETEPITVKAQKHHEGENAAPVSDVVTERKSKDQKPKPARFDPDDTPTGPAGKILADTLIERPTTSKPSTGPSEDDPVIQRRELAAEYYKRRNDMIKQQGGFKRDDDDEEILGALMEERDGKVKKVSRFRAARMKPPM